MITWPNYIQIADDDHGNPQIARRRNDGSYELMPQSEIIKHLNEPQIGPSQWRGPQAEGRIVQHRYLVFEYPSRTIKDVKWDGDSWEFPGGERLSNTYPWMERPKGPGPEWGGA